MAPSDPASSQAAFWPVAPNDWPLGDGRYASAHECPETIEELRQVVAHHVAEGRAIYPQGGRTALDFGGPPNRPGVAIDLTRLARMIDYPAADMTVTVEAGITLGTLQAVLAAHNQRLPLDVPHADRATLGGIFATNTSGPRRYGAGRPRDHILGVGFVTADGNLVHGGGRVVKNVAGYDFPRLLTGSLGALGVIAEMTLKVRPRPEATALVWLPLASADEAATALDRLNTSTTRPIAIELLNRPAAHAVGEPLGLPDHDWVLIVGFEDNAAAVDWQVEQLRTEVPNSAFEIQAGAQADPLWKALTEWPAHEMEPVSLVASLRPSDVVGFVAGLDPARWAVRSHAGNGIVQAQALGEWSQDSMVSTVARLRHSAVEKGGHLVLSRCPTAWKAAVSPWGESRADWSLMARIKAALDPLGLMNPGRL